MQLSRLATLPNHALWTAGGREGHARLAAHQQLAADEAQALRFAHGAVTKPRRIAAVVATTTAAFHCRKAAVVVARLQQRKELLGEEQRRPRLSYPQPHGSSAAPAVVASASPRARLLSTAGKGSLWPRRAQTRPRRAETDGGTSVRGRGARRAATREIRGSFRYLPKITKITKISR